jgi:hypothetical protein
MIAAAARRTQEMPLFMAFPLSDWRELSALESEINLKSI